MEIFDCERYVDILRLKLEQNSAIRGYNSRLAEAASCHSSHLSHVMAERGHLTPDQALAIADFWELPELESDYFLALVEYERAGTDRLKNKLRIRMDDVRAEAKRFDGQVGGKEWKARIELSLPDATTYCSHWYYCVIHCLVEIPAFRKVEGIAGHLNLPHATVDYVLENLKRMGLVAFDEATAEWAWRAAVKYAGPAELQALMNTSQRLFSSYRRELRNQADMNLTLIAAVRKDEVLKMRNTVKGILKDMGKELAVEGRDDPETGVMICLDFFEI